jgi:hypothetical protein
MRRKLNKEPGTPVGMCEEERKEKCRWNGSSGYKVVIIDLKSSPVFRLS